MKHLGKNGLYLLVLSLEKGDIEIFEWVKNGVSEMGTYMLPYIVSAPPPLPSY